MSNEQDEMNRRRAFLRMMGSCAGAAALGAGAGTAFAADPPKLSLTDPTAKALGYVEDTNKVDQKKFPAHKPNQTCGNCQLYTQPNRKPYGPCTLFAGKVVAEAGWCASWIKRAG